MSLTLMNLNDCPLKKPELSSNIKDFRYERADEGLLNRTLVILIITAPHNLHQRHTLRRTWLTLVDDSSVKYYFVIGTKNLVEELKVRILIEAEQYSDLLILDGVDEGYQHLSNKVLKAFVWTETHMNFDFVLKTDDDTFVDVRRLLRELSGKSSSERLYWGYFNGHAKIQERGKWKETEWNLCDRYTPYARGGGYILSKPLIKYLAQNAAFLSIFKNEDVSVGAWLAAVNLTHVHDIRFDTEWSSRGCLNHYLITHPHSDKKMHELYDSLTSTGQLCREEYKKRGAYIYDWSVLPAYCCNELALNNG